MTDKKRNHKGFTLLELLIVIAIIAILSAVTVIVLNPAEMLRKARDSRRISDMSNIRTAIAIWLTTTSTPVLSNNDAVYCVDGSAPVVFTHRAGVNTTAVSPKTSIAFTGATSTPSQANDGTGW